MTEHKAKSISLEEFEQQHKPRQSKTWQTKAIEAMTTGSAVKMKHEGIKHLESGCSTYGIVRNIQRKFSDRIFKVAHAPDGDILVACYPIQS